MHWWVVAICIGQMPPAMADDAGPAADDSADVRTLSPVTVPLPTDSTTLAGDSSGVASTSATSRARGEGGQTRELLAGTPGVHVSESGGMGQLQRLSVRGGAANAVAVLVDGMAWGRAGEGVDLALVPMALLETATLVRGAAAARFGPGAMAGALSLGLSKQREERLFVELLGGSFGTAHGLVGGTGSAGPGHLSAWVQAMHSDGHFRYRFDATPNLPRDTFVFKKRYNNDADKVDTLLHYALPLQHWHMEAWTHLGLHKRGLAGAVENPSPSVRQRNESLRALLRAQGPLGGPANPFALKLSASAQHGNMLLEGGSFGEGLHQRDNNADLAAELSWKRGPHLAYAQGSLRYEGLRATSPSAQNTAQRFVLGGMLGGEAWLWPDTWALNGLVRVDKAGHFANPSAKLGSLWLLPGAFSLAANAGRSFRIPSFFELYIEQGQVRPNPDLLAESAWSFDAGLSWEKEKARATVGWFWSRFENLVVWEYLPPFALKPFNLGRAQTHGLEAEASWGPWPWLHLEGAYGWLQTQNLQRDVRYAKKPLPFRPQHQLFLRTEAGPSWLSAFVEWHFQSSQTRNSFANLSWPARSLVNAGLKSLCLHNPRLLLSLTFKNVLNAHSQDLAGYPLPPLGVFLGLSLSLDKTLPSLPPPASFSQMPHFPMENV